MNTTFRRAAALVVLGLGLTGCSTAPYKPSGMTDLQMTQKMNDMREICRRFRIGDYVTMKFYDGAPGVKSASVAGYFMAYNKMTDTISLSQKWMEYSDRGEPYSLTTVAQLAPAQDPVAHLYKPNFIVRAIASIFTVKEHDNEKAILTQ